MRYNLYWYGVLCATFSPASPSSRVRVSTSRFGSSSRFGNIRASCFFLLQVSEFDLMYSTDAPSLSFVLTLRQSGVFFRPMCVAASSISVLRFRRRVRRFAGRQWFARCQSVDLRSSLVVS